MISPAIVHGKLWQTKAEVDATYGPPLSVEEHAAGKTYVHHYKGFTVLVTYLNGKSQSELYSRTNGKYLVPIEIIEIESLNTLPNHQWDVGNGMFVLIDPIRKGPPVAVAARAPDTAYPRTFHLCTAEFVKKFGKQPAATAH